MNRNRLIGSIFGTAMVLIVVASAFAGLAKPAAAATVPTVETNPATLIVTTAAMLNARIVSDGGSSILERRFSWGTTPSCSDGWTSAVGVSGDYFSYDLMGLNPGTTYYFQAWARNSVGWANGAAVSFATQATVIAATIDSYSPNDPNNPARVTSGSSVTLSVTFTNTGNTAWNFIAGTTIWDSGGVIVGDYSQTLSAALQPGQQTTVNFSHTVNNPGDYWVQFGVWKATPFTSGNLLDKEPSPSQRLIVGQTTETISTPNTPTDPSSGNVGQSLSFSTGGAISNLGHSVQYQFDWGDGTYSSWSSSTSASHSWSSSGTYSVRAQARCATHTSVVSNWSGGMSVTINPPTETISTPNTPTGPSSGNVGQSLSFSTGGAISNLGHSVQYQFDWGDGTHSSWSSSTSASHSWSSSGTYSVRAQARCATHTSVVSSWSGSISVTVAPSPTPPQAQFTGGPTTGASPLTVQFTDQSLGDVTNWAWDFENDGVIDSTEQNPIHTYGSAGTYTVSLSVTGPGGVDKMTKTGYIVVQAISSNQPPAASFSCSPAEPKAGEEVILDASASLDPDGSITSYEWDLDGDGNFDGLTTSPKIFYSWSESGTYHVQLKVIDNAGAESNLFSKNIQVAENSLWEKAKGLFSSPVKTISQSDWQVFEHIKSDLAISNWQHSNDPSTDPIFYWIDDNELLTLLQKEIDSQACAISYETLIWDTLHDMNLADSVAGRNFTVDPIIENYFQNMAEVNVWVDTAQALDKEALSGLIEAAGGNGIGVGAVLDLWDLSQAGVGIHLLDETFYKYALWSYFQNRDTMSPEDAFNSSPVPLKYYNQATRDYFEELWTEYGGSHISSNGGLREDFKAQIIKQLRTLLFSGYQEYKFEPYIVYRLGSPGELRAYDSQGRVTGLVNNVVTAEVPNSAYDDISKTILIYPASDAYYCEVVGTSDGTYGLTATSIDNGNATTFTATEIPIEQSSTDRYTIDWVALAKGQESVSVAIDLNGDGVVERTVTSDGELTRQEYLAGDTAPPAAVTNLSVSSTAVTSVTLTWTAPGNDGNVGTAWQYDVRYSTSPMTDANWDSATQCTGEPSPQPAGSTESFAVTSLSPGTTYYFALKTADEVPNWSSLSNVVVVTTTTAAAPLADTPWPMFQHDARHTGRSPYSGPSIPTLKWTYQTGDLIHSSPSIGPDGTVYVGSWDNNLYAINADGTLKWKYTTGYKVSSSPAVATDGTIYVGSWDNSLYAMNADGTLKWKYTTGSWIVSSPAIGADGTIYVGSDDGNLYALYPNGGLKWKYTTGGLVGSSPAIGPDGTLYVGSDDKNLYAIDPSGHQNWKYTTGCAVSTPTIGPDGTILYVGATCDNTLYAVNPDGSLRWRYSAGAAISSCPVVGADGTVYFGSWDDNLYALNVDGTLKWKYMTTNGITGLPTIGADGTIYVGSYDSRLYAINTGGSLKWSYTTGGSLEYSSPAIGADGTIYVGSDDGKLYALGSDQIPNQPSNLSPANAVTGVSLTPTLQSSAFSDPDPGDTHCASQWQVRTSLGSYSSPVFDSGIDNTNLTSIIIPSSTLNSSTTYYWRVKHQDNHGEWSSWSTETSFTTQSPPVQVETPTGGNVTVSVPGAVVTFNTVTGSGNTTVTTSQGNPGGALPTGFRVRGLFVDISTTATYTSPVTVGISYNQAGVSNPQNLRLFHWEGGQWVDVTTSVDTVNHIVYGQVSTLSPFFIGDPSPAGGAAGVPVFPNIYIGILAALGAGVVAYFIHRRLVRQR